MLERPGEEGVDAVGPLLELGAVVAEADDDRAGVEAPQRLEQDVHALVLHELAEVDDGGAVVGSWLADTDTEEPSNPPSLLVFHADGTYVEVNDGGAGAGAWAATGARTADLTIHFIEGGDGGLMTIRAAVEVAADGQSLTAQYTIEFTGPDDTAARGAAMQIAAMRPFYVTREEVPDDVVASERRIAEATAREEGKPEAALARIVEGRLNGFFKDSVLLEQSSVQDSKKTVRQLLEGAGVTVTRFARFEVGA